MYGNKNGKNQEKKRRTPRRWDCRAYMPARIRREQQAARDAHTYPTSGRSQPSTDADTP